MLQKTFKAGLIVAVLGFVIQDANAFGHRGCGWGGYGGYGGYGCGAWGYGGWYGYGYGYPGYGYPSVIFPASGNGGPITYPNNVVPTPSPGPALPAPTKPTSYNGSQPASNSVRFTVNVPADAKVIINDRLTTSTGEHRLFESKGVQADAAYRYQVRAEFVRDGKPVTEEKTIDLMAGQTASLAFNAAPEAQMVGTASTAQR